MSLSIAPILYSAMLLAPRYLHAQAESQDMHNAGQNTKVAAKETGHAVKRSTKRSYRKTKSATNTGYDKTKEGGHVAADKTKETSVSLRPHEVRYAEDRQS